MRWLDCIISLMDTSMNKLRETVKDREAYCAVVHGVTKNWDGDQGIVRSSADSREEEKQKCDAQSGAGMWGPGRGKMKGGG